MQRLQPDAIPDNVRELFDYLMFYASRGDLGLISTIDRRTGATRYTLFGRHGETLVPLGFLSTDAGKEVYGPGEEPPVYELVLAPELDEQRRAYGSDEPEDVDRWHDDGGACA